jgi:cation diffusion facilitator CzcD-associated flavoprotein CzcO
MKFASGFEIFEYCQAMAERFGFFERCLFHTTVERTEWSEEIGRWTVFTDRGDAMRARYVILANGILTTPKLARIHGMETFEGESFHTRWNYDVDLHGKRVGIIGTGAQRQAIPSWLRWWASLRLPAHAVDHRRARQRETTQEEHLGERAWLGAWRLLRQDLPGSGCDPGQ